jgi:hypothetical protein
VIVFISSVRRGLESERDYLPGLMRVSGYEPRRFADFSAQPVPSRDACLAGVQEADAYLLILGEHYGEPLVDTGKAPTEEEFTLARQRGIPILVFRKKGTDPDDRQREFIARIGDYQHGRFWKEFADNGELAVAVLDALGSIAAEAAPLCWEPATTEPVIRWRADRQALIDRSAIYLPVLEAHLAALTTQPLLPVSALEPLASRLGRMGRDAGLFREDASLVLDSDTYTAWATSTGGQPGRSWNQVSRGGPSGIAADRNGTVLAYASLPRDTLGTLVNNSYLAEQLETLLRIGYDALPANVREIAPTAGLEPVDRVIEGNPAEIGHRSTSTLRMSASKPARTTPDTKVTVAALPRGIPEIARELAARLMAELRTRR